MYNIKITLESLIRMLMILYRGSEIRIEEDVAEDDKITIYIYYPKRNEGSLTYDLSKKEIYDICQKWNNDIRKALNSLANNVIKSQGDLFDVKEKYQDDYDTQKTEFYSKSSLK